MPSDVIDIKTRRKLEIMQLDRDLRGELLPYYRGQLDVLTSLATAFKGLDAANSFSVDNVVLLLQTALEKVISNRTEDVAHG